MSAGAFPPWNTRPSLLAQLGRERESPRPEQPYAPDYPARFRELMLMYGPTTVGAGSWRIGYCCCDGV